jgi:uncharacterized membrane protein YphA (DoxX/SURF4 family)
MLSIFPTLFTYSLVVPLVFRIVIGLVFLTLGYKSIKSGLVSPSLSTNPIVSKIVIAVEIAGGILLIIGLWTQIVAMILSALSLLGVLKKNPEGAAVVIPKEVLALLLLITASLIFLGPGFYAFDLPL